MKQYLLAAGILLAAATSIAWISDSGARIERFHADELLKFSSGAPTGRTGAPGEGNCTSCHSGSAQSGAGTDLFTLTNDSGPISSYFPDSTYTATLTMGNAAAKNGFELVALSSANAQAGLPIMISGNGAKMLNGSAGKKYITHNSTQGNVLSSWTFLWKAPSTNVGAITFYVATNQTNSDNGSSGDIIRLSQFTFGSDAGVKEVKAPLAFEVRYNENKLQLDINSQVAGKAFVNIVDLNGKSVFTEETGNVTPGENSKNVLLPSSLRAGMYVVNFSVDNAFAAEKIYLY